MANLTSMFCCYEVKSCSRATTDFAIIMLLTTSCIA